MCYILYDMSTVVKQILLIDFKFYDGISFLLYNHHFDEDTEVQLKDMRVMFPCPLTLGIHMNCCSY